MSNYEHTLYPNHNKTSMHDVMQKFMNQVTLNLTSKRGKVKLKKKKKYSPFSLLYVIF